MASTRHQDVTDSDAGQVCPAFQTKISKAFLFDGQAKKKFTSCLEAWNLVRRVQASEGAENDA